MVTKEGKKSTVEEFFYFARKYFFYLLVIALLPVTLYAMSLNLGNYGGAGFKIQGFQMFQTASPTLVPPTAVPTVPPPTAVPPTNHPNCARACSPDAGSYCQSTSDPNNNHLCQCTDVVDFLCGGSPKTHVWSCEGTSPSCPNIYFSPTPGPACNPNYRRVITCNPAHCRQCNAQGTGETDIPCANVPDYSSYCGTPPTSAPQPTSPPPSGEDCHTVMTDQGPGCWCSQSGWQYHYCATWPDPTCNTNQPCP